MHSTLLPQLVQTPSRCRYGAAFLCRLHTLITHERYSLGHAF